MPNQYLVETDAARLAESLRAHWSARPGTEAPWLGHIYKAETAPVVIAGPAGWQLRPMRFGFMAPRMQAFKEAHHNVRSEGVAERPTFRQAFQHSRCLIPMYAFCEWADEQDKPKWVGKFAPLPPRLLGAAGIWTTWQASGSEPIDTFGLITREAPTQFAYLNLTRVPLILPRTAWEAWLDATLQDPTKLNAILAKDEPVDWEVSPAERPPRRKAVPTEPSTPAGSGKAPKRKGSKNAATPKKAAPADQLSLELPSEEDDERK